MKYSFLFILGVFIVSGCGQFGLVTIPFVDPKPYNIGKRDIIKEFKTDTLIYYKCKVYLQPVDTSQISFWDRGMKLNKSKSKDYKIYEDMIDWFDLEKTDKHKYKNPEIFFVEEFNTNFIKGFRSGDDRFILSEMLPNDFIDSSVVELQTKQLPTNPKISVELLQPKQIEDFCNNFSKKYKDADFVILNSGMGISLGTFDGFVPSILSSTKKRACAIRVPKTIIDIKNKRIAAYFLEQNNLYYNAPLQMIKEGIIEAFEEVGKAFNSDF